MPSNGRNKNEHWHADNDIPLEDMTRVQMPSQSPLQNGSLDLSLDRDNSLSSEDEDNVYYIRKGKRARNLSSSDSNFNLPEELTGISSLDVGWTDVVFDFIVWVACLVGVILEFLLVFWHYHSGNKVVSAVTVLWIVIGGFGVLKVFWGVSQDKLERLYGKQRKCVRITVNCFPWIGTIITSFVTFITCRKSMTEPMQMHSYVQLQEFCRMLLRLQSFCQSAPQSITQFVILLENYESVGFEKGTVMILCVLTNLTTTMIANLPIKSDDEITKASYNPYSRLFIGLRMMSSFGSRTLAISYFISSFRCVNPSHSISPTFLHVIPISIIFIPRLLISIVEFVIANCRKDSPSKSSSLSETIIIYIASVFFPFGEPRWIFWYVSIETISFIIVASVLNMTVSGCVGVSVTILLICLFIILFVFVPVVVPFLIWIVRKD